MDDTAAHAHPPARPPHPPRLSRPLVGRALLFAMLMLPVGMFLSVVGISLLELSGGAAFDTSLVIVVAAFGVADFWGGGILARFMSARAQEAAVAWAIGRLAVLLVVAAIAPKLLVVVPVQLAIALPAAFAGARMANKHAAILRAEQEAAEAAAAPDAAAPGVTSELHAPARRRRRGRRGGAATQRGTGA